MVSQRTRQFAGEGARATFVDVHPSQISGSGLEYDGGLRGTRACGTFAGEGPFGSRSGQVRDTFGNSYWWKRSNTFEGCEAARRVT